MEQMPLVSIGMPVYNGEKKIKRAIDSLLQQDYPNIDIVVCNNNSTDRTAEMVDALTQENPKLAVKHYNTRVSIKQSYERALQSRKGKYFMFAPADDYWSPDFVSKAVAFLECHQDHVGCCGRILLTDEDGVPLGFSKGTIPIQSNDKKRLSDALMLTRDASRLYGLLRSDCLENVIPGPEPPGWDHYTLAKLAMRGKFALIDTVAMYREQTPRHKYSRLVASQYKGFMDRALYRQNVLKLFDSDPDIPEQPWLNWKLARLHFLIEGAFLIGFRKDVYVVRKAFSILIRLIALFYRMINGQKPGR